MEDHLEVSLGCFVGGGTELVGIVAGNSRPSGVVNSFYGRQPRWFYREVVGFMEISGKGFYYG